MARRQESEALKAECQAALLSNRSRSDKDRVARSQEDRVRSQDSSKAGTWTNERLARAESGPREGCSNTPSLKHGLPGWGLTPNHHKYINPPAKALEIFCKATSTWLLPAGAGLKEGPRPAQDQPSLIDRGKPGEAVNKCLQQGVTKASTAFRALGSSSSGSEATNKELISKWRKVTASQQTHK